MKKWMLPGPEQHKLLRMLTGLLCLAWLPVYAQDSLQSYHAPFRQPEVSIVNGPVMGTRPFNAHDIRWKMGVTWRHSEGISHIKADLPLFPHSDHQYRFLNKETNPRTNNNIERSYEWEAGGGFFLTDQAKPLSASRQQTMTGFAETGMMARHSLLLQAGYLEYRTLVSSPYIDAPALVAENGTKLAEVIEHRLQANKANIYHTSLTVRSFKLGLAFREAINSAIKTSKGVSDYHYIFTGYADFLYAPDVLMDPLRIRTPTGFDQYNILHTNSGGFEIRRSGFRAGVSLLAFFNSMHALRFQLEGGVKPGLQNVRNEDLFYDNHFFMKAAIGYGINF